jgi:hypothetical protein
MLGMILRGEAEIAVAEFTMTALRAGAMDFTVPLIDTRCTVLSLFLASCFPSFSFQSAIFCQLLRLFKQSTPFRSISKYKCEKEEGKWK